MNIFIFMKESNVVHTLTHTHQKTCSTRLTLSRPAEKEAPPRTPPSAATYDMPPWPAIHQSRPFVGARGRSLCVELANDRARKMEREGLVQQVDQL